MNEDTKIVVRSPLELGKNEEISLTNISAYWFHQPSIQSLPKVVRIIDKNNAQHSAVTPIDTFETIIHNSSLTFLFSSYSGMAQTPEQKADKYVLVDVTQIIPPEDETDFSDIAQIRVGGKYGDLYTPYADDAKNLMSTGELYSVINNIVIPK